MMNNAFWSGIFFIFLGLYLLKYAIKSFRQYEASKSWPTTQGQITASQVVRYQSTSSRRDFIVKYEYQVKDKQYEGYRVALYTIIHQEEADNLAKKYPANSEAIIHYEPNKPSNSILITGGREDKKYGEIILAIIAVIAGILIIISGFHDLLG